MKDIKLRVMSTEDSQQVVVEAETVSGEDVDIRSYFMPPEQAVAVGAAILQAAEHCGVVIQTQSAPVVTPAQYAALCKRTEIVMRSMSKARPDMIAKQVVDTILAEIL